MDSADAKALTTLETPALVLNKTKLVRNIARLRDRLARAGVPLRPHFKTSKSFYVLRLALEGQPGGVTVSTLKEAEYCLANGVKDILYGVGIAPNKISHIADLKARGAMMTVVLDNLGQARALEAFGRAEGMSFDIEIEIDSDGHRSGVKPQSDDLSALSAFFKTPTTFALSA